MILPNKAIPIGRVRSQPSPAAYFASSDSLPVFQLGQSWLPSLEPNFLPGLVQLSWTPACLVVLATLEDREIVTTAVADNERMWELGDTFEVFLQIAGRSDYLECHVAPNNHRMHLKLPGRDSHAAANNKFVPFETMTISPVGFSSEVTVTDTGWRIAMTIPAGAFDLECLKSGETLNVSFCRYDAARDRSPVLSSSSNHKLPDFHRCGEWKSIELIDC